MAVAIPIMMAVGTALAAYGAYQQGAAARKASNFNAAVARQNAIVATGQAKAKAAQIERENILRLGLIRANQGASGGTMEGSVLDVIGDVASQGAGALAAGTELLTPPTARCCAGRPTCRSSTSIRWWR